jgi:hypothetical protein
MQDSTAWHPPAKPETHCKAYAPVRAQTRGEHGLLVRDHGAFRPFGDRHLEALGGRFVDAALEHERPSLLLLSPLRDPPGRAPEP